MKKLLSQLMARVGLFKMDRAEQIDWTEANSGELRGFLKGGTGEKLLEIFGRGVAERAVNRSQDNATPWENGFTAGQADVMYRLLALAEKPQDEEKPDEQ